MKPPIVLKPSRHKAVWGPKRTVSLLLLAAACLVPNVASASSSKSVRSRHKHYERKKPGEPGKFVTFYKGLDAELSTRSKARNGLNFTTRVIVTLKPGAELKPEFKSFVRASNLDLINGLVLELPNGLLKKISDQPGVLTVHFDRPIKAHNYRTAVTVGARAVQSTLGYTGSGVGVAIIDSGVTSWHDDLTNTTSKLFPYGNQRVAKFVDFVNGRALPYDDNGHGSHVAGIIMGNGKDSSGEKTGIAPKATLVALKVLDARGQGTISNIISALSWVARNAKTYNIRVVNMSVGARISESYWTDPLTLATKALTDQGITVVTAAGNIGKNANGKQQYGGITAPGNAPWVLTVGASSTMGTLTRNDDQMADFSSAGPTAVDFEAKPDLVAPGVGTVSLAVPGSTFYVEKVTSLLNGSIGLGSKPYLALSGTSMAAPVVTGTVALMLQANPNLTPNLIKALLQYTAQVYPGYSPLREGAGFLNTLGAVQLARYYANPQSGDRMPIQRVWSRKITWGSHRIGHGFIKPSANAWKNGVVWGSPRPLAADGDNIVWGTMADGDNIVWGTMADGDNIVWGTMADGDNIVWGTDCGNADCDNVVWGTADGDNIVWGTADDGDNIVWGTSDGDNIVWGTSADDTLTWASDAGDEGEMFPDDASEPLPSLDLEFGDLVPLTPVTPSLLNLAPVSIGG